MPPRAVSLAFRLWSIAALTLIGSVALLFVSMRTIDEVKIQSPLYKNIISYKDLLADILPPPEYLIESYLTCYELLKYEGQERLVLLKKMDQLEKDYLDRNAIWQKELTHPGLRRSMLDEATPAAIRFFKEYKEQFVPKLQMGQTAEAAKVLDGPLTEAYRKHRLGVDKTVDLANKEVEAIEATADATLVSSTRSLIIAAVGINLLVLVVTFLAIRSILRPMNSLTTYAHRVSEGDYDCTCQVDAATEINQLASVLSETVAKVKDSLGQATEAERKAQQQADNAKAATAQAEQAQAKAEQAMQQGKYEAALRLERVVEIVGSASDRLATQIDQSSKGSQAQAEKASSVATAMEEMNASVMEVAHNATSTAETSSQAQQKAKEGAAVVRQVIGSITEVEHSALSLKNQMTNLGRQSEGIGQILNVISDIADQTNLLALNAAIEAARAGDAGRGFAVVADEVRKLAEKTMTATKQVGDAIKGVQASTRDNITLVEAAVGSISNATRLAGDSGAALEDIVRLVETASDQVHAIATAAEQQSAASDEINQAVEEVNTVARETSIVMSDAANAVQELSHQAGELRNLIGSLKEDNARG